MFKSKELDLDLENNRYKRYFRFIGIPFNEGWKNLPKVAQVAVTGISVSQTMNSPMPKMNDTSITSKDFKYFVFLIISKSQKIEVFRSGDHTLALEKAKPIADYLKVRLVDYASAKK